MLLFFERAVPISPTAWHGCGCGRRLTAALAALGPRQYTGQSGRIKDVALYGGSGALATASDSGSIHCIALTDGGVARLRRIAPEEGPIVKLTAIPHKPSLLVRRPPNKSPEPPRILRQIFPQPFGKRA